jgi:hypothetical protein
MNLDIILMLLVTNMITFFFTGYYCKRTFIMLGYKLGCRDEQVFMAMVLGRKFKEDVNVITDIAKEYKQLGLELEQDVNARR